MKQFIIILVLFLRLFAYSQNQRPIAFIENNGQIVDQKGNLNNSVKYLLNTNGLNVLLRNFLLLINYTYLRYQYLQRKLVK